MSSSGFWTTELMNWRNMDPLSPDAFLWLMEAQGGALIEVCVTSASYDEWVATFDALVAKGFPLLVKRCDVAIPPVITTDMFADGDENSFVMSVEIGRQLWTTNFYSVSLIDFQGSPRDILDNSDIEDARGFMQVIANATGRTVRMVPETFNYETEVAYMLVGPM
ncbi:hypothetical protein [Streptacidiphilus sp. P02-A3a]|uniref:hypothetical protein n=1 Tax=Streptacidiphilus sp. P02-A3a TaxID=2704468 RepID=UPI0015FCBA63|nr:hypothetical protein [Streptacidiphilus sp. P02-A3a]QMU70029.1 hypothetical protein GXP74_19150 [Streptacidiphilus sp. P02-A3a]